MGNLGLKKNGTSPNNGTDRKLTNLTASPVPQTLAAHCKHVRAKTEQMNFQESSEG
jgi:hypothetical protein